MKVAKIEGVIGWTFTVTDLERQMDNPDETYKIILDSPGGFILDGFSIYNFLKRFKEDGGSFSIEVDFAGSMTSVIAMAADNVTMRENSSMMFIHRVQGCACGDADDMFKNGEDMLKLENLLKNIYLAKGGRRLNEETIIDLMESDTWLTAAEAKTYGLADTVIKEKKASRPAALNLGGGLSIDIAGLAQASAKLNPLRQRIESADNLKSLEAVLRDAGRLSKNDTQAVVSRVSSFVRRDAGRDLGRRDTGTQQTANSVTERIKQITQRLAR